MDLATLAIEVKSKGIKEATRDLSALDKEAAKSQKQADKVAKDWKRAGTVLGAGIAAGVGIAAVAMKKYFENTIEAEKVQAQLTARIKSTAGAARLSLVDLNKMAEALQFKTSFDDESIGKVQATLLTFTKLGRDVFPQATEAVLDLSTALGTDLESAALQVGKALNDPVAGVTALSRAGIQFSKDQKALIKTMVDTGDAAGAQKLVLRELEKQMGGSAVAARNTLGGALKALENSFNNLLEGDSKDAGVIGARKAIEDLNKTLNDPQVKKGFADMVAGFASIASAAASAIGPIAELIKKQQEAFAGKSLGNGRRTPSGVDGFEGMTASNRALLRGDMRTFVFARARALQSEFGFGEIDDFSDVTSEVSGRGGRSRNARGGSNRPETGNRAGVPDPETTNNSTRAVRANSEAQRDNLQALRDRILATDDFDARQIALESAQHDWSRGLEDITASLQGPAAESLLEYTRNLEEVRAAYARGAVTAPDLLKWETALGEQYKANTAAAEDYGTALDGLTLSEQASQSMGFAFEDAFASILDGSRSAKDAFADFSNSIIKDMARILAQKAALALFGGGMDSQGNTAGSIADLFSGDWGFAKGGWTGNGPRNKAAGIVHGQEGVLNADAMQRVGIANLNRLNAGAKLGDVAPAASGSGEVSVHQTIMVQGVVDKRTAQQIAQDSGRQTRMATSRNS